jgi:phenylacetate-CoA ligase
MTMREWAWRLLRPATMRELSRSVDDGRGDPRAARRATEARLSRAIADAARHIPFYRDHWAGRGVLAAAEAGNVNVADLPVLTRGHLREAYSLLRRPGLRFAAVVERTTGGSTGEPVRFVQSTTYVERGSGRGMRSLVWGGWNLTGRTAMVWGGPSEVRLSNGIRGWLKAQVTNRRVYDAFRTGEREYGQWLSEWIRWRPQFVIGYASALDGFAGYLLDQGRALTGVSAVFSTAEKLYPHQRVRIEQAFRAPVRDQYGSREVLSVAAECTKGALHAYLDSAYLELLPRPEGEAVTLTQLDNPVMPLIRYVNGDLARWSQRSTACACGLHYPVLAEISGRTSDLFRLPSGKVVHGEFFTHVMYDIHDVAAFQFYQGTDGRITLFVVPGAGVRVDELQRDLRRALEKLPAQLDADIGVELRVVSDIPRRGQGKHRFTISEYVPNG